MSAEVEAVTAEPEPLEESGEVIEIDPLAQAGEWVFQSLQHLNTPEDALKALMEVAAAIIVAHDSPRPLLGAVCSQLRDLVTDSVKQKEAEARET